MSRKELTVCSLHFRLMINLYRWWVHVLQCQYTVHSRNTRLTFRLIRTANTIYLNELPNRYFSGAEPTYVTLCCRFPPPMLLHATFMSHNTDGCGLFHWLSTHRDDQGTEYTTKHRTNACVKCHFSNMFQNVIFLHTVFKTVIYCTVVN